MPTRRNKHTFCTMPVIFNSGIHIVVIVQPSRLNIGFLIDIQCSGHNQYYRCYCLRHVTMHLSIIHTQLILWSRLFLALRVVRQMNHKTNTKFVLERSGWKN